MGKKKVGKKDVIDDCTLTVLRSLRRAILAAQVGAEEGDEFLAELGDKLSEFEPLLAEKVLRRELCRIKKQSGS